jgi:RNA polymerase sigma-70 factor (ECF subfamily)
LDEQALIRKAQKGDTDAFAELVTLHERFVYNLALRTIGSPDEAEDIAQEAFFRAWQGLPSFRFQSAFRTWIYRIVINLCINRYPHLRRELDHLATEELIELPETRNSEANPETNVEHRELRTMLHDEIDRLPDSQRLLISLRYQNELSYEEISGLLGLPIGTVKTGLFRAKERLRQLLAIYVENPL